MLVSRFINIILHKVTALDPLFFSANKSNELSFNFFTKLFESLLKFVIYFERLTFVIMIYLTKVCIERNA